MNTKIILAFLKNIAANNNREWFQEHKSEYEAVKKEFEAGVEDATLGCFYLRKGTKGFARWLLHSFRTEQLLGCGGFLLVTNQHTNLVPQRNNG